MVLEHGFKETLNKDGFANFHQPKVVRRAFSAATCRRLLHSAGHFDLAGTGSAAFRPFSGAHARVFTQLPVALQLPS
jgi:hypothetical protein